MSKIKSILAENYRATGSAKLDLYGASCIVTAANSKGKTSLLRGLFDRIWGEKPELILSKPAMEAGAEKGEYALELTDGARILWEFSATKEKLTYFDPSNQKTTTGVIGLLQARYFGAKPFDIDSFLRMQPAKQAETLIGLSGGGAEIRKASEALTAAMESRKKAKQQADFLVGRLPAAPSVVPPISDIELVNALYTEELESVNKAEADRAAAHAAAVTAFEVAKTSYNRIAFAAQQVEKALQSAPELATVVDAKTLASFVLKLELDEPEYPERPAAVSRIRLAELEAEKTAAWSKKAAYDAYLTAQKTYETAKTELVQANSYAAECEQTVKEAKAARTAAIKAIALPDGFSFAEGEEISLVYEGYALDIHQALSNRYIAALKLGSMLLKDLKSMHFEASALDFKNLDTVIGWAHENGLQLLIEMPDRTGEISGITYEIRNNLEF